MQNITPQLAHISGHNIASTHGGSRHKNAFCVGPIDYLETRKFLHIL